MTIILNQPPPSTPFLMLKHAKQLRKDDTVIFQWGDPMALPGVDDQEHEHHTTVTNVYEGPGIYSGYQLIGWENKAI